jgi:hypothetical protein
MLPADTFSFDHFLTMSAVQQDLTGIVYLSGATMGKYGAAYHALMADRINAIA